MLPSILIITVVPFALLCWVQPELLPHVVLRLYRATVWAYAWSHGYVEWQEQRRIAGRKSRERAAWVAARCLEDLRNPMTEVGR